MHFVLLLLILLLSVATKDACGFNFPTSRKASISSNCHLFMATYSSPNETTKQIYSIHGSGWKSSTWNWGYAQGTGHDCAAICRRRWDDRDERRKLVQSLLSPVEFKASHPESEVPFEEVKLILGLAWQQGRWDGSDGGPGGYGAVLSTMADARRYEKEDEVISALNFIEDISAQFETISRNAGESKRMKAVANDVRGKHAGKEEIFMARRTCAGMVLDAMNFVDNGL
eukprot:CAMPEP_0172529380 /NCGR_PEP_ID=MMETSP1067-20121228/3477_1 /TAXON_ID=265564 ORGANISM="Thalassiosira punctigera, Strain Tpunct2005C2" /NCGR_SAMPLE_ID=MMETSP1067 /ASSEMBLY_ACC=CAM_ASM_000444 /LENGTH=227 /DNA_ID=CAMNT_0013313421 /DNA_START=39 /DNA_END=722 /DNA_ORIENTATION=-